MDSEGRVDNVAVRGFGYGSFESTYHISFLSTYTKVFLMETLSPSFSIFDHDGIAQQTWHS